MALIINDSPSRLLERQGQERMETTVNRVLYFICHI